jgi:tRNA nucleotidyltransferase (CCA-adding enzyme)
MRLLDRCDAIRQPERFARVLQACECDARGRLGFDDVAYPQAERLLKAQQAALSVETASIAQDAAAQGLKGPKIGEQIAKARVKTIATSL